MEAVQITVSNKIEAKDLLDFYVTKRLWYIQQHRSIFDTCDSYTKKIEQLNAIINPPLSAYPKEGSWNSRIHYILGEDTNRKKMIQILELTFQNTLVCPAVLRITEKVRNQLGF